MKATTEQILAALDTISEADRIVLPVQDEVYPQKAVAATLRAFGECCRPADPVEHGHGIEVRFQDTPAPDRQRLVAAVLERLLVETLRSSRADSGEAGP